MIRALREILDRLVAPGDSAQPMAREEAVRLATAVLLVETARADHSEKMVESATVFGQLQRHFGLAAEEAEELMALAESELDDAVSLQHFTRQLHETLTEDEKLAVIEMLWKVAFADGELHAREESLVRKVGGLLYMREADMLRLRNRVREESPQPP
jgi:uncharacterized tellurite resistance protein B-like protein